MAQAPSIRLERLRKALLDAYILLSRGYPRRQTLDMVKARYSLNQWESLAVYHCLHPYAKIREIRAKTRCQPRSVYAIDGYNVAVSLYCIERGIPVLVCPDGYTRDVMGGWKPRPEEVVEPLTRFLEKLEEHLSARPVVYLDSRVSRSGVLASMLRRRGYLAATSKTTDKSVLLAAAHRGYTPLTSDIVILEKAGGCNYLTHYAVTERAALLDVPGILSEGLEELAELWGMSPSGARHHTRSLRRP